MYKPFSNNVLRKMTYDILLHAIFILQKLTPTPLSKADKIDFYEEQTIKYKYLLFGRSK